MVSTIGSAPLVEPLPWDTEFFGRPIGRARIGRLDAATAARMVEEARAAGLECVYFAAAADDFPTVLAAEREHFHLVDVRVVLERSTDAPVAQADEGDTVIGPAREDDLPRLEHIAADIARASRYAADPHFSREDGERLYRTWIRNAWHGYADTVLVARPRDGEAPLGFLCPKIHGELCDLQLIGVASEQRQRKVGRTLVAAGIEWGRTHGAARLQVVTQGRNVPAQRLYQQLGFLTTEVKLYYHLWLTPRDR